MAVALALAAASAAGANPATSPEGLGHFLCEPALESAQREISVQAVMHPIAGTKHMAMRFVLLKRATVGGSVTEVSGRGLGNWTTPTNPTLGQRPNDTWKVDHPVIGLAVPGSYRLQVTFRWIGSRGRVLATEQRTSRPCRQPDLRPDLLVQSITVEPVPNQPARNEYVVLIRNRGLSAAGPFKVLFAPGGANSVQSRMIGLLRAHSGREVDFTGPACTAASAPTVTIDPGDQVDDLNRSNNSGVAACPTS